MIIGIIQARTGSSRLPGKIFMEFKGKPNLLHVFNRVSASKKINTVIIATTDRSDDDKVFNFCKSEKINCYRGSESDVLDRFYRCGMELGLLASDIVVRITADCPLIDPFVIDNIIEYFEKNNYDYVSNTIEPTYPDGLDVEVFSYFALKKSWEEAKLTSEREHVTPYIRNHAELFKIGNYENNIDLSHYRWTLDEIEDYQLIAEIYKNLYSSDKIFTTQEVLSFLDKNPHLKEINNKYARNEGYVRSLKNDKKFERSENNE